MPVALDRRSEHYLAFLEAFACGFHPTQMELHRWLLLPVLTASPGELRDGLGQGHICRAIDRAHPAGPLNPGNVTQALKSAASLQAKLGTKPIVLEYERSSRSLVVVDPDFPVWLDVQDRGRLLAGLGLPAPEPARVGARRSGAVRG
ncbi:hypothetical protein FSW04_17945 [Baekduia soli]|uniref:Uncharacterized protein n=1 Tax=Baekduia soli TaxID=496014 RepID=A0A5B8U8I2_9ACTN|nr:hypothetical protein [Baekduia soli]QEC49275.1 hypothetical protein FSW04_17945 [Baekduia soli]